MIEKLQPKTVKIIGISLSSIGKSIRKFIVGKVCTFNFKLAKAEAIRRCETENRKVYVIQESAIHWKVFSTKDINHLKRTQVFKKDLSAMEMTEKSAFVANPKNKLHDRTCR